MTPAGVTAPAGVSLRQRKTITILTLAQALWDTRFMKLRLMSRPEIAELLDVSDARVRQLDAEGRLPEPVAELRVGRIWLAEDVEAWAAERVDLRKKGAALTPDQTPQDNEAPTT